MATITLDFRKAPPAQAGARQDRLEPGVKRFRVTKFSDADSAAGKTMYSFTSEVRQGKDKGKKTTDRFAMPKSARESLFPVQRLHAFLISVGANPPADKPFKLDLSRLVNKEFYAEVGDEVQAASTGNDGRTFPERTVSRIFDYLTPKEGRAALGSAADDEDEDEEDEDEEEDLEDELDDDEDEDDEEDEDEDEEPAPPARRTRAAVAVAPKAAAKAAPKASRNGRSAAPVSVTAPSEDDDDDDFPFDDDDEEEEEEPAPVRRRARR